MRRNEVLENVQALAEVSRDGNGSLDDRAIGLGHQAAHASELADLRDRTARTGVGHHEDRVERLLLDFLAVPVRRLLGSELFHHDLADLVTGAAPDVDDLVVALALRDETRGVLRLDLLHFLLGAADDFFLLLRHDHVVDRD